MAKDITDVMRDTLNQLVRDATKNIGVNGKGRSSGGPLSGVGGMAAGAGLAALAPVAAKAAGQAAKRRLVTGGAKGAAGAGKGAVKKPGGAVAGATSKLGDAVGKGVGEKVKEKVDESGGVGGVAKSVGKGILPSVGSDGGGEKGAPGVGTGRRMPVQQSMDVAVPLETCYNQWSQFEDWPQFMHRVTNVEQEDPCTVSFTTKIWAKSKPFTAKIETQRPDERIKWRVSDGILHTGVVTFHELAPRLTRVELSVDVDPGSLLEKAARGMRHIKRAMRADLHRFKAYIEMQELETGAWRGVIEDGELVEDHDPSYDEERDYSDAASARADARDEDEGEDEEPEAEGSPEAEGEEEEPEARKPARAAPERRGRRRPSRTGSGDGRTARRTTRRRAPAGRS